MPQSSDSHCAPKTDHVQVHLVGGQRIFQHALGLLLAEHDIVIRSVHDSEQSLAAGLAAKDSTETEVIVLVLSGVGPFGSFQRINDALSNVERATPLVVLSERASRGQVYAALRIGARGYVNLDADPRELVKAIHMAASDKVYLSPDATELLVNDISTAIEPNGSPRLPSVDLSKREMEVVQLMCEGLSSKEIARHLHISAKTVENHRYNIYRKVEVDSIAGLMRHALQQGMVTI